MSIHKCGDPGNDDSLAMTTNIESMITLLSLPVPVREYQFAPPRRWRFDWAWPEYLIALEYEGGTWTGGRHTRGKGYEGDCEKYSRAAIMGWCVIRVTEKAVQSGLLTAMLKDAFSSKGFF